MRLRVVDRSNRAQRAELCEVYRAWKLQKRAKTTAFRDHWLDALALARGDKATAKEHATEARRLATCDGPPDYTYKVAYDEAGALLAELK